MKKKSFFAFLVIFTAIISNLCFCAETMTQEKAQELAYSFFIKTLDNKTCGSVANGIDKSSYWEFQPYRGVTAKPTYRKIHVNKTTGKVSFGYSFKNTVKILFP